MPISTNLVWIWTSNEIGIFLGEKTFILVTKFKNMCGEQKWWIQFQTIMIIHLNIHTFEKNHESHSLWNFIFYDSCPWCRGTAHIVVNTLPQNAPIWNLAYIVNHEQYFLKTLIQYLNELHNVTELLQFMHMFHHSKCL